MTHRNDEIPAKVAQRERNFSSYHKIKTILVGHDKILPLFMLFFGPRVVMVTRN